jgi:hypothetical protein
LRRPGTCFKDAGVKRKVLIGNLIWKRMPILSVRFMNCSFRERLHVVIVFSIELLAGEP